MSLKKVHEEGFLVFDTVIGEITVALPDANSSDKFKLDIETNDKTELTEKIIFDFTK